MSGIDSYSEELIPRIKVIAFIEKIIEQFGISEDLQAQLFRICVDKYDSGELEVQEGGTINYQILQIAIIELFQQLLTTRAEQIPRPAQNDSKFTAIYTGQLNPPTKGHDRFLRELLATDELSVVTGPDSERPTSSGETPLKMRRFLMSEFLKREFGEELAAGRVRLYPEELSDGSFPERVEKWRAHYGDSLVFCCGSDTYNAILERYPDTLISVPIIGMGRIQKGEQMPTPFISRIRLTELFRDLLLAEKDLLLHVFNDHHLADRLESLINDTAESPPKNDKKTEALIVRLANSERITVHGKKTNERLLLVLRRLQVYAKLLENSFALEKALRHTSIIGSDQDENSSTRDRLLFAYLPEDSSAFEEVLKGKHVPSDTEEVEKQIQSHVDLCDWTGLRQLLSSLETSNPQVMVAAIRRIVHESSLAIIYENGLAGLYRDQRTLHEVPVTAEILSVSREISQELAVLNPSDIDRLSAPSQYHLSRSLAGAFFSYTPDDPHLALQIPRRVLNLSARNNAPKKFIPSVVIDKESGAVVGILMAHYIPERGMIKHERIIIDPTRSRQHDTAEVFNQLIRERIEADLTDPSYKDMSVLVAEVPAHETERISQHLLGNLPFAPCGLEPQSSVISGTVEWRVQGIYLKDLAKDQGDYYLLEELQPLATAVLRLVAKQQQVEEPKFSLISENNKAEEQPEKSNSTRLVQRSYDELIFEEENHGLFSIYPNRSRQLDLSDFEDDSHGADLLKAAIDQVKKLYDQDEWPEPYIKIALPVDARHSLKLQKVLLDHNFVAVRFIPASKNSSAMMTFALMLGDPQMNDVDLPSSRVSGLSHEVQEVFGVLTSVGEKLHQQGTRANKGRSTRLEHIRLGRMRMRSELFSDVLEKLGHWQLFPSLYAHLHEVVSTLELFRRHIGAEYKQLRLAQATERKFIALHDSGKAIWAVANRFCREGQEGKQIYEDQEDANAQLANRVQRYIDQEFEVYPDAHVDWAELKEILTPKVIAALKFDHESKRYKPISDLAVTVGLIQERMTTSPTLKQEKHSACQECIDLYFSMPTCETRLRSGDEDIDSLVESAKNDKTFFYFSLLELIDNTSRYKLTNDDGSLSLRDLSNGLDLKRDEVLARYGDEGGPKTASIERKFAYLSKFAESLFT